MRIGQNRFVSFQSIKAPLSALNRYQSGRSFSSAQTSLRAGRSYMGNTLADLLSGHRKNSYGVEGMDITGGNNDRRIIKVSDEIKTHIWKDIKSSFYKRGGMSGSTQDMDAYFDKIHAYIKKTSRENRKAAAWTLSQLSTDLAGKVARAVKEQVPDWNWGQSIPQDVLDEIFSDDKAAAFLKQGVNLTI